MWFGSKARVSEHYKFSLDHALKIHFKTARSLLVIEEDAVVAPDFLWCLSVRAALPLRRGIQDKHREWTGQL